MMPVKSCGEKHKSESPHPTGPWNRLSRLTLSHSAQQHNNAKSGRDQLAHSLHHPHATSLQFFIAAMNSAKHKKPAHFSAEEGWTRNIPRPLCG